MDLTVALIGLASALVTLLSVLIVMVRRVHVLVNSQHDEQVARIKQLTEALLDSDTAVPDKPGRHE